MKRLLTITLAATLGLSLATSGAALATPSEGDDTQATTTVDGGDAATVTVYPARRRPPRRRPVYRRRPVRRPVYRAPRYVPRPAPRRPVERLRQPEFFFGVGVHGTSFLEQSDGRLTSGLDTGGGFSLDFGWRVAPRLSLDFGLWFSFHRGLSYPDAGDAAQAALTADLRFFLADPHQRLQPYIQAGLGAYTISRDGDSLDALSGPGFQLGGGVDFYLSRAVSIGGRLLFRGASLDNGSTAYYPTEEAFMSSFSYSGNLKFHF